MSWFDDLDRSTDAFQSYIIPVLPRLILGKYKPVEGTPEEIAKMLDERCGIDGVIDRGDIIYALGSRIQIDSGDWRTFTIRCERGSGHITELEKLRKAIKNDALRPQFTLQAYIVDGTLRSVAVARTKDIIEFIDNYEAKCQTKTSTDNMGRRACFKSILWRDMQLAGYKVNVLTGEGLC